MYRAIFIIAMLSIFASNAQADQHTDDLLGKVVFTSSKWEVRAKADPMTDKKECFAALRDDYRVQASIARLYISFKGKGGVSGYEYRLDNLPKKDMKLASDIEKKMSTVILGGPDFNQIKSAKRIRIQVVPILSGLLFEDISLSGLSTSVAYMEKNCR